eukprot:CAMPEP_0116123438 /NCGR_PEP_ID=MMETSP0329-20121206/4752_1 /TAXON_ID=697910 /ORGANISM="Pseudo-nitzschia arenysensis, Strain B593" /LENGTH=276 /DNA_ID=CAMNT_0003617361 /DNA_START=211 /DNA_END=1041 /DNA_ORIENTATION=+
MSPLSHVSSRSIALPIVLVTLTIILSTANGFSIPSKANLSQHSSTNSFPLFANPSKSALNFAETDDEVDTFVVDYDFNDEHEMPPKDFFSLPQHQNIDLHGLDELAPLERQILRMEGLDPYVLVSVLTSTTSYNTICGTQVFQNGHLDVISALLLASGTLSAVFGVYATTVFSMCVLYGKTALGLDKEDLYYRFMEATRENRIRGYKAFSLSLLLFLVDIFLIAIDQLPTPAQGPAAIFAAAATFFGCNEFIGITKSAAPMFQDVISGSPIDKKKD